MCVQHDKVFGHTHTSARNHTRKHTFTQKQSKTHTNSHICARKFTHTHVCIIMGACNICVHTHKLSVSGVTESPWTRCRSLKICLLFRKNELEKQKA